LKENLTKLKILIAPLDWGLGHTTRCVSLIKALQKFNADIWIAGNEMQKKNSAAGISGHILSSA